MSSSCNEACLGLCQGHKIKRRLGNDLIWSALTQTLQHGIPAGPGHEMSSIIAPKVMEKDSEAVFVLTAWMRGPHARYR